MISSPRCSLALAIASLGIGCGSTGSTAELESLEFEIPASWQRTDTHVGTTATAVFEPEGPNPAKQSITVIRAELGPIATKYSTQQLAGLLEAAQTTLPQGRTSRLAPLATERGLSGLRIEVDYVPAGLGRRYHRIHALLMDGTALVHVLFTAVEPAADQAVFQRVVDTLHEES